MNVMLSAGDLEQTSLQGIAQVLASIQESETFTDATIACNDKHRAHRVHRCVICPQSSYFAKALTGPNYIECNSSCITLPFPPPLVERLVQFFYQHHYSDHLDNDLAEYSPDQASNHEQSDIEDDPAEEMVIPLIKVEEDRMNVGWMHAAMYSVGDYIDCLALKRHSEGRFKIWADKHTLSALAPEVAIQVFEGTPEVDKNLRDILVTVATQNPRNLFRTRY